MSSRGAHIAARAVDVQLDVVPGLGVQEQHGSYHLVSHLLVYGLVHEQDALLVLQAHRGDCLTQALVVEHALCMERCAVAIAGE